MSKSIESLSYQESPKESQSLQVKNLLNNTGIVLNSEQSNILDSLSKAEIDTIIKELPHILDTLKKSVNTVDDDVERIIGRLLEKGGDILIPTHTHV